ncbi:MAG: aspartate kinase [Gemmatimonadetes bacterium]|nr:aspartate kinase [Gemmatimonadota bacterium]
MALLVQKYGGTSVGTPERIRAVAGRVARAHRRGDRVVVVVSAMGHTTDELVELAQTVTGAPNPGAEHAREMDMLLSAGERISMALLAMAICQEGVEARSLTGSQAAIITDQSHTAARIVDVRADRVRETVEKGCVAIIAGFQGVSTAREITTLGRGGSDTTAVALARALEADRCEIYTDVEGVFTCDPRRVPDARIIPRISHDEMVELAQSGAQVMHARAVDLGAREPAMDIRVLSSFAQGAGQDDPTRGTLITRDPMVHEDQVVTGLAPARGYAKLIAHGLPRGMRTPTELLVALADAGVSVDMVTEAPDGQGGALLQLTVREDDLPRVREIAAQVAARLGGGGRIEERTGLSRIALVGRGMSGRPGVYAQAYRTLMDAGVEVEAVSTSSISITLLVPSDREDDALRALHDGFTLGRPAEAMAAAGVH